MITAEIITIGDEILIGQIIDTNSAWIGEQLKLKGISVSQITTISDKKEAIIKTVIESLERSPITLITGGLGPTKDDITKQTLCEIFDTKLVVNESVLAHIKEIFAYKGLEMIDLNAKQAEVPETCTVIPNKWGTAPCIWFEKEGHILVSMPGVPYEMKGLMETEVIPRLVELFSPKKLIYKTVLTQGMGESFLAELIADWETELRSSGLSLAYLPSPGLVRLRIGGEGSDELAIFKKIEELKLLIPQLIFGYEKQTLEEVVGELLLEKQKTLATAESCTGGYIAHLITSVAGSSNYFKGCVVAYANEVKVNELNISQNDLDTYGAVSQQVVEQMAAGVLKKMNTDYAVATSGVAGPDGGTDEKPVGTIWIAIASENGMKSKKISLGKNRERNIRITALIVLNWLRREIKNE